MQSLRAEVESELLEAGVTLAELARQYTTSLGRPVSEEEALDFEVASRDAGKLAILRRKG